MSEQPTGQSRDATEALPERGLDADPTREVGSTSWLPSSPDLSSNASSDQGSFAAPGGGATAVGSSSWSGPPSPPPQPASSGSQQNARLVPDNPFAASAQPPYGQGDAQQGYGQQGYGQQPYSPGYGPPPQPGQPGEPGQSFPSYSAAPAYSGSTGKPWGATSGRATAVLVLGIASIPGLFIGGFGFITAIVALVLAPGANREIRGSGGAVTGESQVRTGRILAIIALVLAVLIGVLIAAFIGIAASHSTGGGLSNSSYN